MVRYMRPHGRFAHCSCKNAALTLDLGLCIFTLAVRQPPVLASCVEIYYFFQTTRLRTVDRQRKWPLPAPVRKIMALKRKKMALGCQVFHYSIKSSKLSPWLYRCCTAPPSDANGYYVNVVLTGVE